MRKSRYSDNQILAILKQNEQGVSVNDLCREHGMSSAQFYKWRAKYGGMDASMMKRLKALEAENARLSMIALMEPPMFALMAPRRGTVSAFQTG